MEWSNRGVAWSKAWSGVIMEWHGVIMEWSNHGMAWSLACPGTTRLTGQLLDHNLLPERAEALLLLSFIPAASSADQACTGSCTGEPSLCRYDL